jgi:hypothetical protein
MAAKLRSARLGWRFTRNETVVQADVNPDRQSPYASKSTARHKYHEAVVR